LRWDSACSIYYLYYYEHIFVVMRYMGRDCMQSGLVDGAGIWR
jgi:hypothetical protein